GVFQKLYPNRKLNIGALGNIVRQLHIHVIARHEEDEAWPGPVWGVGKAVAYQDQELSDMLERLKRAF
ncbi:MAG TPA: HIT domain-containing protein, partial [Rhizobiales bacterium]|nr:HIT domain-containing protein [Hyphomicrobiales bacterium]